MSPPAWRSDRLPAAERPQWLPKLARGNYRYLLDAGSAAITDSWRARDAARSLQEALSAQYPVSIVAIPGPRQHIPGPYYPSRRRAVDPRPVAETTGHRAGCRWC